MLLLLQTFLSLMKIRINEGQHSRPEGVFCRSSYHCGSQGWKIPVISTCEDDEERLNEGQASIYMVTKGECAHSWISPISNNAVIHTSLCIMYTKTSVFKYAMYLMLFLKVTPVKRDISGFYINTLNPLWKWLISTSVPKAILQFYKILTFKTVTLFIKR